MSADQIREARLQREIDIAAEPVGDFWIGRRWYTKGTRFWGYVRRPRQPWSEARLVMVNESQKLAPDRLPEEASNGNTAGFDHNFEYQLWGHFTGDTVYDPNSNLQLPEFKLNRYEMINNKPGYVFEPWERYWSNTFPPLTPRTVVGGHGAPRRPPRRPAGGAPRPGRGRRSGGAGFDDRRAGSDDRRKG